MATNSNSRATLTVPARYLDDMRAAMVGEVVEDSGHLLDAQGRLTKDPDYSPEDRDASIDILRRSLCVLDALAEAGGEVTVDSEQDRRSCPLAQGLHTLVRQLSGRLADAAQYEPVPMGEVLDIAERLRWAAQEAIRIEPSVAE